MPIIEPSVFYWTDVLNVLDIVCTIVGLLALVVGLGLYIPIAIDGDISKRMSKKMIFAPLIAGIALVLFSVLIPDAETMYRMIIAKYATYENVAAAGETIKSVFDYVVESAKLLIEAK